ncbi:glycerate kinase [Limnohabitans sp. 2KL-1]|jgi:hypothetical protein|uniref:glycerate kinase n=1 Tax=Limnohabitans sp. 2KL-1 TaxID=1100699 RepID=UPI000D3D503C|nr:glycerate kinase [Limnohabitans sp. 2KL-1]PUE50557.1 glycerate kinase [Limnohabitans sp. 2KL-1]
MNFNKILAPLAIIVFTVGAWQAFQWAGIALAAGGVIMWVLLHFTRMVTILKKAANRPIGHVASAVMLNAKLKKGATLMHVIAMTRSLGKLLTEKDAQPEIFRWTDTGQSHVTCTFVGGKLTDWSLTRPAPEHSDIAEQAASAATVR